jgi:uncharacterized protein with FMN-binding domain
MAKKMSRRLVALSSSAIAAIYLTGYVMTQSADTQMATGTSPIDIAIAASTPASSTAVPSLVPTLPAPTPVIAASAPSTTPAPTATQSAPAATATYRDGTYSGQGTSRRGGFTVAVTVQGDRIVDVTLTKVTTQYPASRIAALPGQVVARQSANVDRVTGATYSVQAFQQAVQQALAQARVTPAADAAPVEAGTGTVA